MSKIKIQIKSIYGSVLFEYEKEDNTVKDTVIEAVRKGANLRGAYLRGANLSGAYLRGADLRDANLRDANLRSADLRCADLRYANLSDADLSDAYLSGANLRGAYLSGAYLRGADLRSANLRDANLRSADLRCADLSDAYLSGANLRGAYLSGAYLNEGTFGVTINCPEEGSFVAYKKCQGKIVKLLIPEDAKRSSAATYKCRASKATCLEIEGGLAEIASDYDAGFIYRVGETIEVPDFDEDRWNECSTGIHFFINKEMARCYR